MKKWRLSEATKEKVSAAKKEHARLDLPGCLCAIHVRYNLGDRVEAARKSSLAHQGQRIAPEKLKRKNATLRSPEGRKKMSRAMKASSAHKASVEKRLRAGGFKAPPFGYRSGHRDDIGIFVRSSWEANYARYLNFLRQRGEVISWLYEPKRFYFSNIKRGTRSYLPDFKVLYPDKRREWHEVKSYWTQIAKTAVKRFRKYYPDETLVIIDKDRYREIEQEFSDKIPKWEKGK